MDLEPGLYEQLVNVGLEKVLEGISNKRKYLAPVDKAEASRIISNYLKDIVKLALDDVCSSGGSVETQVEFANKIIGLISQNMDSDYFSSFKVSSRSEQLLALVKDNDPLLATGKASDIERPETSISCSSLFTGAIHEPQMYSELNKEIASSDNIDMLVSFIKWSGLRLIIRNLEKFTRNGGRLRVITTSYMGATDIKAIEELEKLPNTEIKISYDTKRTRLHAKTYVFYRNSGFSCAYVGSSNLSSAAVSSGLEWNIKVANHELPDTMDKIGATFESYWNSNEFEYYDDSQKEKLAKALRAERYMDSNNPDMYTLEINPYSYQQDILDKLEAERCIRGHYRNLIVAATGTGKTVISAFDYRRFRYENPKSPCRLLFVAHREEILKQSIYTFRAVLRDANFGSLFVGSYRPDAIDNLFISIQTFNSQEFSSKMDPDYYDYIIVDEFHHAASPSYRKLLSYYRPKILLGLTATPERMDGKNVLEYFDDRIAAEIRLPEAIDRKLLCPFQYFGVSDNVDLDGLRWSAGGYDRTELSNIYTISGEMARRRANLIVGSVLKYVTDINDVKGLGFCVSVAHANFMAEYFNSKGIPSISLSGQSSEEERQGAKDKLVSGNARFIFVVDIYNEGVDIPEINTILFLRPTESLTVFLQQLGRGLRLSKGKECLTVLDFIGQAHKKYSFESKFLSLLENTGRSFSKEVKEGFTSVPKGCYIQLEKQAQEYILNNIKSSFEKKNGLISRLESFAEDSGHVATLDGFLDYYHLDPRSLYKFTSFSRLSVYANLRPTFTEGLEEILTRAFARICVIDSRRWIRFLLGVLQNLDTFDFSSMSPNEKRMMQMFYVTIFSRCTEDFNSPAFLSDMKDLASSSVLLGELISLLEYKLEKIDFVDEHVDLGFDSPLDLYCTYTRDQILVALDFLKPSTVREGVKWLPEKKTDVFFVTLNKSDKDYSPSTMYQDYSINENLFHWQSQSTTSTTSATGKRYINHIAQGTNILLFVREFKSDRITNGAEAYTFLGKARYVSHSGSRPMNITWHLERPIPARFMKKTNKLIVG